MAEIIFGIAAQMWYYLTEMSRWEDLWIAKLTSYMSKRCSVPHQMEPHKAEELLQRKKWGSITCFPEGSQTIHNSHKLHFSHA